MRLKDVVLKISIALIALMSTSCSRGHKHQLSIDPAFQSLYIQFLNDAAHNGRFLSVNDLIIRFEDLGPIDSTRVGKNGQCALETDKTPVISINTNPDGPFHWQYESATLKENLLYHELGHCVLHRLHNTAVWTAPDASNIPVSIMFPTLINELSYIKYHAYYLNELFSNP